MGGTQERLEDQRRSLPPISTFRYRPAKHTYLASLGFNINGHIIPFSPQTILVTRGQILFGRLDNHRFIRPICDKNGSTVTYNFDQNRATLANRKKNELYGVGSKFTDAVSNNEHELFSDDLSRSDSS